MNLDIVRVWKNEIDRSELSREQLALLPENPVGELELTNADLEIVYGGQTPVTCRAAGCYAGNNSWYSGNSGNYNYVGATVVNFVVLTTPAPATVPVLSNCPYTN
jgi:mersacidin/lichenicidin family type 2 lantibiotic